MTILPPNNSPEQPPSALSVPLSRSTSRVGGGSAFFVRPHMNLNAIMPFVILVGIFVFIVLLRMAKGSLLGGAKKAPIIRMLSIGWFVFVLLVLLFLILYKYAVHTHS